MEASIPPPTSAVGVADARKKTRMSSRRVPRARSVRTPTMTTNAIIAPPKRSVHTV